MAATNAGYGGHACQLLPPYVSAMAAAPATRPAWVPVAVAGVSMGCDVAASAVVLFATATNINGTVHHAVDGSQLLLAALIWAVVAVVNVAYARRR